MAGGKDNVCLFFFFNDAATTEIYTLPLHDALPISYHKLHLSPGHAGGAIIKEG